MEEVNIKGLEVKYEKVGEGAPLLLLHGWGASIESWKEVVEGLNGYEVFVVDLPGFGESDTPKQPWTIDDYLDFIKKFVDKLELEDFYLLGHSFGGSLAVKFVVNSNKVKKLMLVDSAGIRPEPKMMAKVLSFIAQKGEKLFVGPLAHLKNSSKKLFYKLIKRTDYGKANKVMKETMKNIFDYYSGLENKKEVESKIDSKKPPAHPEQNGQFLSDLEKVDVDTFLVWGEQDEIIPLRYGKIFNKKISNSELKIIPESGHSPHLDTPSQLKKSILNFFE